MRILFFHKNYPGPFAFMVEQLASRPGNEVSFASMYRRRDFHCPNVKHMLLRGQRPHPGAGYSETWLHDVGEGNGRLAFWRRLNASFRPDWVLYSACNGLAFFMAEAFPDALRVFYAQAIVNPSPGQAARMDMQAVQIMQSQLCFIFSNPASSGFPKVLVPRLTEQQPWLEAELWQKPDTGADAGRAGVALNLGGIPALSPDLAQFINGLLSGQALELDCICDSEDMATSLNGLANSRIRAICQPLQSERARLFNSALACLHLGPLTFSAVEPMACACPVIISPTRGRSDLVRHCLRLPAQSPQNQAKAVLAALKNRQNLAWTGSESQKWAKAKFGPETLVPGHIGLIEQAYDKLVGPAKVQTGDTWA